VRALILASDHRRPSSVSLATTSSVHGAYSATTAYQLHRRQRLVGRHVGAHPVHGADGFLGLREVVPPRGAGVSQGLADNGL